MPPLALFVCCCACAAELTSEDFGLLQLYAESFQTGGALATYLKSYRAANKKKAKSESAGDVPAEPAMSTAQASTITMVTASALAAQVYPDSRFGSLHAKQLTGARARVLSQRQGGGVCAACFCFGQQTSSHACGCLRR